MKKRKQQLSNIHDNINRKAKILFTTGSLAVGGAERWIVSLIKKLDPAKFEPAVVTVKPLLPPDDLLLGELLSIDIPVYSLNLRHYQLLFPLGTMRMKRLLKNIKPDLIQTNLLLDRFYGVRAAAPLNIPIVSTLHGTDKYANLSKFKLRINIDHLEVSDAIVANSQHTRDYQPEEIREAISVIHVFVDVKHFAPSRHRSFSGKQEFTLGAVSRLAPVKNIPKLIKLFAEVKNRLPFIKNLIIVGEGPERPAIESAASDLGLSSSVTLVGNQNDVRSWYEQMDFFMSTSKSEGMGLSMLEAMASSVIPIVTGVGGVLEAIDDGENGFLLDPGDMTANVQKLETIFADCVKNPSKFNNMAKAARKTVVSKFSSEVIVPQYEDLFLRIAEGQDITE